MFQGAWDLLPFLHSSFSILTKSLMFFISSRSALNQPCVRWFSPPPLPGPGEPTPAGLEGLSTAERLKMHRSPRSFQPRTLVGVPAAGRYEKDTGTFPSLAGPASEIHKTRLSGGSVTSEAAPHTQGVGWKWVQKISYEIKRDPKRTNHFWEPNGGSTLHLPPPPSAAVLLKKKKKSWTLCWGVF